jgi:asparagine synthase (glutamine-hydrolysing)
MCGFAGLYHRSPPPGERLLPRARHMADLLEHRGPDDSAGWEDPSGRVALAFRRLAILDLSEAGRQPMTSASGRYVMVFNGEVYNFQAIRARLQLPRSALRSGSDTEVLLAALDRWGVEATLPELIGMFAIAVWDLEAEALWLIRDRIGIKPLYLGRTAHGVAFASELGALTRAPGMDTTLDPAAIESYLRYLYIPGAATPFRDVRKVPPGHYVRIGDLSAPWPAPVAYWSLREVRAAGATARGGGGTGDTHDEGVIASMGELLSDAVRLRMIADVPVGALLSGGIDSSLVVALMQEHSTRPVRTFTVGFEGTEHDESAPAAAVAAHLGTDHTELQVTGQDALDLVPRLPAIFSEPLANPSQIPTQLVSRLARQTVTVALAGDGGDELFAGYNRYTAGPAAARRFGRIAGLHRRWAGRLLQGVPVRTWDRIHAAVGGNGRGLRLAGQKAHKLGRMMGAGGDAEMYRVLLSVWDDPGRFFAWPAPAGSDPLQQALGRSADPFQLDEMLQLDQAYYLPDDLLQKVDRASMSVSLELRVPLLDHRVVERSWALPPRFKIRAGESKWILRQILDRHVPRALVERPKTGFSVPVDAWLAGPLRPWAEDLLLGRSPGRDALFRASEVERAWKRFLAGGTDAALGLWSLTMLEAWRRHWGIENVAHRSP